MEGSHASLVETHQPLLLHGAGRAIAPVIAGAGTTATSTAGAQPEQQPLSQQQLQQLVAPIALYPDALLAQVLPHQPIRLR